MAGLTFDTGALIGLERRRDRIRKVYAAAIADGVRVTVPAPVVAEWYRAPDAHRDLILRAVRVEPLDERLAKLAGLALAHVAGATTIDAIVMASAAQRGDVVYTSDFGDLSRLAEFFPGVRVLVA